MKKPNTNQADFIEFCQKEISDAAHEALILAVIEQSGGWNLFTDNYNRMMSNWRLWKSAFNPKNGVAIQGWSDLDELSAFYTKHKDEILKFSKLRTDEKTSETIVQMVAEFDTIGGLLDLDQIAEGMHVVDSEHYRVVSSSLANFIAVCVAFSFIIFLDVKKP